ncbi:methyl-accepting chemotaxis protein [Paucibacter sp. APW11]|uniref:Methyl-accepting chemotaxis protein n=1 Tax=Roseateles aquae TaxID=3077235 RepID=A0ABU3P944_9BURK|nr:methyl-accepting chemotaxis protein [Paucibacter sp. APW11]MDT8999028.1 methyl-accepting chemotaxis protein [Paucibacter sp. APW11]
MRDNGPVSGRRYDFPDGKTLVSTTDLKGRIVYCNTAFVEVSGYERQELLGQPHNLIRHPDMPEEAFRDMWATIAAGLPWSGVVVNRRKDGGHYWVRANVTPLMEGSRPVGYMSVRNKPDEREVAAASALYQRIREQELAGRPLALQLHRGQLMQRGWRGRVQRQLQTLRSHAMAALPILSTVLAFGLGAWLGEGWLGNALAVAVALVSYALTQRVVMQPVRSMVDFANRMAAGDLTQQISIRRQDSIGHLAQALNQLNVNLQSIVGDARSEVSQIDEAISEIANGNSDMSTRTEAQASSLQQTAASMEQLTGTVRNNAHGAQTAAELAELASRDTAHSTQAVREMGETMHSIREASRRIAEITQVIDAISFQTNILALNAAVEAARAGDAGRGFAVVASEVRALAQRTTAAAKEIRGLIDNSERTIEIGVKQSSQVSDIISGTANNVARVSQLIAQISQASDEQLGGLSQINAAVTQLDGLTQQNAAMVEELAASASSLHQRARMLDDSVQVFRLDKQEDKRLPDAVQLRAAAKLTA